MAAQRSISLVLMPRAAFSMARILVDTWDLKQMKLWCRDLLSSVSDVCRGLVHQTGSTIEDVNGGVGPSFSHDESWEKTSDVKNTGKTENLLLCHIFLAGALFIE